MFTPNSGRRLLLGFLFAVLLGVLFAQATKAQALTPPNRPVTTQAVIWNPSICDLVEPYGYAYYLFYCDQRTAAMLVVPLFGQVVYVPVVVGL